MKVQLVSENDENYLGLKKESEQTSRFWQSKPNYWISEAKSRRMDIKRTAYLAIYQDYMALEGDATKAGERAALQGVLQNLSVGIFENGQDGFFQASDHVQVFNNVQVLCRKLYDEDARQYAEFHETLSRARHFGLGGKGQGCNDHLANIITIFTLIYGEKPSDNPLLYDFVHQVPSHDLLDQDIDTTEPGWQRQAVQRYMKLISVEIRKLIAMTPAQFDDTFQAKGIQVAVVRELKREFNRLSAQVDHGFRFKNDTDALGEKKGAYELAEHDLGTEAEHAKWQSKLTMRTIKAWVFWAALVCGIIISGGQVAIAVFTATGAMIVAIGLSTAFTNTILFTLNIAGVFTAAAKWRVLFQGMTWRLILPLVLFFGASLATGIVNGGFVLGSLLTVLGGVTFLNPLAVIVIANFIAALTILGITSMLFMVGLSGARALRGKTVADLYQGAKDSFASFMKNPDYDQSILDLEQHIQNFSKVSDPLKTQNPLKNAADLAAAQQQVALQKLAHNTRYVLKLVFTVALVPAAIITAVVATYALSQASSAGTRDMIKATLGLSDVASRIVTNALIWGPSFFVQWTLSNRSLVVSGVFFAGKFAQIASGIGYGVLMVGSLILTGRLGKTVSDGYQAFHANPYKTVVRPSLLNGLLVAMGVAIVLNGYGNGSTLGQQGTFPIHWLPQRLLNLLPEAVTMTTIMATASSITLNWVSFGEATQTQTPTMNLDKGSYADMKEQLANNGANPQLEHENFARAQPNADARVGSSVWKRRVVADEPEFTDFKPQVAVEEHDDADEYPDDHPLMDW